VPFCQITLRAKKPQIEEFPRYPEKLETLGDYIRKRRLDLKLTAKQLGKILHVDMDTVYSWEYHKTNPNPRRLSKIIEFLGGEPDIQMRRFCGEKILAYRKQQGLSQRQLALKLVPYQENKLVLLM
jgi:transcriptional regulator with XRE-family HTH domain